MGKLFKAMGVLALLLMVAVPAKAVERYTVESLGKFSPKAINNRGEVVGFAQDTDTGYLHAVLFSNGSLKNLITLGGKNSQATDINDNGDIVGYSDTLNGSFHAFLYSNNTITDLHTLGGVNSQAFGINSSRQIVGSSNTIDGSTHTFVYSNGLMKDLDISNLNNGAGKINNHGQIVGSYNIQEGGYSAFSYLDEATKDLNTLGGKQSSAWAINESGQIVGVSTTGDGAYHAFLYRNGKMTDIDTSDSISEALDINNSGQVVGGSTSIHAFLYENNQMHDLNELIDPSLEITLNGAWCINDNGQIVANNAYGNVFLLTPIPEPSSMVLLVLFFSGFYVYIWRRSRGQHRYLNRWDEVPRDYS
jgi:probable HAF family extracellular repeat protein